MYPKLKILRNKECDKLICEQFLNYKKGGVDFGEGIIKEHPELTTAREVEGDEAKRIISDYFDSFYSKFDSDLSEVTSNAQNEWKRKKNSFFKACDKYFDNHHWPEGKYEAYPSIINCNPRFLDYKIFQFYWKDKHGFSQVVAHEMLHFLFYDLVAKLLPNVDLQSEKIWELSEVFDGLIMSEEDFVAITNIKTSSQYPTLIKLQEKLRPIWNVNKMADKFILSAITKQ